MKADTCGCCEPVVEVTPVLAHNRPELSAIAYRVGSFTAFRQAMIEAIADAPELARLSTRLSDDYAITIVEMWATIADILTFYQERIANEAYLRTACQRDSVQRLARLIDYALKPGIAATAYLAFTAENEKTVRIPIGLRVQSVPGQDEKPQKYETLEAITADSRLNRLRIFPASEKDNPLEGGRTEACLVPGADGLNMARTLAPDDRVVLFKSGASNPPPIQMLHINPSPVQMLHIKAIRTEGDRVFVSWRTPLRESLDADTQVFKVKREFRLFGYNVAEKFICAKFNDQGAFEQWHEKLLDIGYPSKDAEDEVNNILWLDGRYSDLKIDGKLLVDYPEGEKVLVSIKKITQEHHSLGLLSETVTKVEISPHATTKLKIADRRGVIVYELAAPAIRFWSESFPPKITQSTVYLPGIQIDNSTIEIARSIENKAYIPGMRIRPDEIERGRTILLMDERQQPIQAVITDASISSRSRQGHYWKNSTASKTIQPWSPVPPLSVSPSRSMETYLKLELQTEGTLNLLTQSAVLLGNVALGSHGETLKAEVLGDGDTSAAFQTFSVKKKPVTFVASADPGAMTNSLRVLVNNILWDEVPSLYGRSPKDQVYATRIADDGTLSVRFGDGITGARLPSGRGNVVARYRQGAGLSGRVRTKSINTLLDRPQGLKAVTNPSTAEGGADPERLDQARKNGPTTVRTFGRAVSLRDFEDLATSSGEVAKAQATWVWNGWRRAVHLTVAGQQGGTFTDGALTRLHAAISTQRDPNHSLFIANYRLVAVVMQATVGVNSRYVTEEVVTAARTALLDMFSFDRLEFGLPLHVSHVYPVVHSIAGVEWVDVDLFHFKDRSPAYLANRGADDSSVQPHLRIYPARIDPLVPITALPAEQAHIEVPSYDLTILASEGLPPWGK